MGPILFFFSINLVFVFYDLVLVDPGGGTHPMGPNNLLEADKDKHDFVFMVIIRFFNLLVSLLQLVEVGLAVLVRKLLRPKIQSERFVFVCHFHFLFKDLRPLYMPL